MKFKLIVLLLAISLVVTPLASCGGKEPPSDDNTVITTQGEGTIEKAAQATTAKLTPDLSDADFGGAKINFLVKGEEHNWYWCSKEIYAENETGEQLNDAVYRRNRYLEDKYKFEIKESRVKEPRESALKSIKADDGSYDVIMTGFLDGGVLAQGGYLMNLHDVPNINLSKPWWDQRAVKDLSIGKKLYFALGDINVMDNDATWGIIFSKQLIKDRALDDPYTLVRDNKWVMDKMYDMMKQVSADVNGDGIRNDQDDYGQLTESLNTYCLYIGGGGRVITKDEEDYPVLSLNNERSISVLNKALDMMLDSDNTLMANDYSSKYANPWDDLTRPMFKNNRGLFYVIGLGTVNLLRDMESDFGILPMPKYDAAQDGYYCDISAWCTTSVQIPITSRDPARTGHIVEAMAAESMYTITPAYYDINFVRKAIRDDESIEMLQIILNSRSYDLGPIFDWGQINSIFGEMTSKKTHDFSSMYDSREDKAKKAIEKTIEAFKANN